jgi:hypothetical protein
MNSKQSLVYARSRTVVLELQVALGFVKANHDPTLCQFQFQFQQAIPATLGRAHADTGTLRIRSMQPMYG